MVLYRVEGKTEKLKNYDPTNWYVFQPEGIVQPKNGIKINADSINDGLIVCGINIDADLINDGLIISETPGVGILLRKDITIAKLLGHLRALEAEGFTVTKTEITPWETKIEITGTANVYRKENGEWKLLENIEK